MQELFLAYTRLEQALEQQQVAMKLNKLAPGEMQTFWVVCSMVTQAIQNRSSGTHGGMPEGMLISLASGVAGKHLNKCGELSYEALLLYMDLLQAQGKYEDCEALLESPCAASVHIPHELQRLKVSLFVFRGTIYNMQNANNVLHGRVCTGLRLIKSTREPCCELKSCMSSAREDVNNVAPHNVCACTCFPLAF
jgi:hypothetical protein